VNSPVTVPHTLLHVHYDPPTSQTLHDLDICGSLPFCSFFLYLLKKINFLVYPLNAVASSHTHLLMPIPSRHPFPKLDFHLSDPLTEGLQLDVTEHFKSSMPLFQYFLVH
jgi:hypothetical protein